LYYHIVKKCDVPKVTLILVLSMTAKNIFCRLATNTLTHLE